MTTESAPTIAFLGMGLLGSGFVRALRKRGTPVRVWNRTASKAKALEADGATAFDAPADAVKGAARIHLTLSDDGAVDDVLEKARPGFAPGVILVDHTTTSASGTRARVERWKERGVPFLHAPVFMGPQNALESTGFMLVSGDPALVDPLLPELAKMTGKVLPFGPSPERAATFKLLGNLWLMFMVAGVADMFTLAKGLGVTAEEAAALFDAFNPGPSLPGRAKKMAKGDFSKPSWELAMARKDARLMIDESERANLPLAALPAIAALMDRYLARGHGGDDWTVIAKDGL
jgi:3-hydroxyisobutyrate dehydrogenase